MLVRVNHSGDGGLGQGSEPLGKFEIPLVDLTLEVESDEWMTLLPIPGGKQAKGRIHVAVRIQEPDVVENPAAKVESRW